MNVTILKDEDTRNGRMLSLEVDGEEMSFTFPLDMDNNSILKKIRALLESEYAKKQEFEKLIQEKDRVVRLTNTVLEVL